jgi:hypothetical protein
MKIGIYVPVVVKQKKLPLLLGKVNVKALLPAHITINFVVKPATIITPVDNVMRKYILPQVLLQAHQNAVIQAEHTIGIINNIV